MREEERRNEREEEQAAEEGGGPEDESAEEFKHDFESDAARNPAKGAERLNMPEGLRGG